MIRLGKHTDPTNEIPFELDTESFLISGKNNSGKRALQTSIALQKIAQGKPIVFLDNDDEAIEDILQHMPEHRQKDVIYCSPSDAPFGMNPFDEPAERHELLTLTLNDGIRTVYKFDKVSTANITETLIAGTLTLLTVRGTTLLHLEPLLTDPEYRARITAKLTDPFLIRFWQKFEALDDRYKREQTRSTLSKLSVLGMLPSIRSCIGQLKNNLVFKDKIVLLSLKESHLGSENTALLGAFALISLYLDAVQGLETTLFIRNAHRFMTALVPMLQDCKNIQTIVSVKHLGQLGNFESALLSGVDHIVTFRIGQKDSLTLKSEFPLGDGEKKPHQLEPFDAMVSGFQVTRITTEPHHFPKTGVRDRIVERCRRKCTIPDEAIAKRLARIATERTPVKKSKQAARSKLPPLKRGWAWKKTKGQDSSLSDL
jgi:hypothetical protein